jgi:uncharacterized protein (DUF1778 family)
MTKEAKARLDMRIRKDLKERLSLAAENTGEDMTKIVEDMLDENLPKLGTCTDGLEE